MGRHAASGGDEEEAPVPVGRRRTDALAGPPADLSDHPTTPSRSRAERRRDGLLAAGEDPGRRPRTGNTGRVAPGPLGADGTVGDPETVAGARARPAAAPSPVPQIPGATAAPRRDAPRPVPGPATSAVPFQVSPPSDADRRDGTPGDGTRRTSGLPAPETSVTGTRPPAFGASAASVVSPADRAPGTLTSFTAVPKPSADSGRERLTTGPEQLDDSGWQRLDVQAALRELSARAARETPTQHVQARAVAARETTTREPAREAAAREVQARRVPARAAAALPERPADTGRDRLTGTGRNQLTDTGRERLTDTGRERLSSTGPVGGRAADRAERQAADAIRRRQLEEEDALARAGESRGGGRRRGALLLVAVAVVALVVLGVWSFTSPRTEEASSSSGAAATTSAPAPAPVNGPLADGVPSGLPPLQVTPLSPVDAAPATPVRVPVTVLNATTVNGLAARIQSAIQGGGWEAPLAGPYTGSPIAVTTVYFAEGDENARQAAVQLKDQFPQIASGPVPLFFALPGGAPQGGVVVVAAGDWQP